MSDKWLLDYDACLHRAQDVMEMITERNRQPRDSSLYMKKTGEIHSSLSAFNRDISRLRDSLNQSAVQRRFTERECDRRQTMMDQLVTRQKQLELTFENRDQRSIQRSNLLGGTSAFADDPWSAVEERANQESHDHTMSVDQIRQQQQQIIAEQDRGLDVLSRVVGRQKQIAVDIGNEVESQNEIIDDIVDHTDVTSTRLINETRHIKILNHKSGACWMYVIIVLLAVAVVVIACVPFK